MYEKLMKTLKMDSDPRDLFKSFCVHTLCKSIPDEGYLKLKFWIKMGKKLDLKHPQTFNEKIQWLKLYDRKPKYIELVDKYEVRKHIKNMIGEEYLIPLLGAWEDFERIDFAELPNRFVFKCTHDSGGIILCKDKERFNKAKTRKKLEKRLANNYYYSGREWPYKNIKPRIICEEVLGTESDELPSDYKFHCFNGKPRNVMVCTDRGSGNPKYYFFDQEWKLLRCNVGGLKAPEGFSLPKPEKMDEMFEIAATLSKGVPFVRVDLYFENGQIYFGELTFHPQSGFDYNLLPETDDSWGRDLELPSIKGGN